MSKKFSFRVCSILRTRKLKILFAALDRERTPFEALYFEALLRNIKQATYEI